MKLRIALVIALLLETGGTLQAQDWFPNREHHDEADVSEAAKQACEPEVFRLCVRYIPDHDAITACLHNNVTRLNTGCRAVIEGRQK